MKTYRDYDWIAAARTRPVTDIGQIPPEQVRKLNALARKGVLRKGIDSVFPVKKRYWVAADYSGPLPEDDPPAHKVAIDCTCARCRGPAVIFPATRLAPNGWCFCPKCSTTSSEAEVSLGKKRRKLKRRKRS